MTSEVRAQLTRSRYGDAMSELAARPRVGPLLRDWRQRRRLSQLDLAVGAGVSARHVSFVETGRARPSAEMVMQLAEHLDVPLRDRNALLLAAGYAPAFAQRDLDDPEMGPVRDVLDRLLRGHEPYPAIVVDRHWGLVAANRAVAVLTDGRGAASARAARSTSFASACIPTASRRASATSASGARTCSTGSPARRS